MKQFLFIEASGAHNNDLSLLYKTENGYLFAIHIDQFSDKMQKFWRLAQTDIISYIVGDKPLIEVTHKGATLLNLMFSTRSCAYLLNLVKVNHHGKEFYEFHTTEDIESGKIKIIN